MAVNHKSCFVLFALLLLSNAALTFHVTTHVSIDQANCDYCVGDADPTHAIAYYASELQSPSECQVDAIFAPLAARLTRLVAYRERAPPAQI